MNSIRKVTVTALPKTLTGRISPKRIIKDPATVEFLERMKPFVFGKEMIRAAELVGLDLFSFVFVQEKPFYDYAKKGTDRIFEGAVEPVRLAILMNLLYRGAPIRLLPIRKDGGELTVCDIVLLRLNLIDTSVDYRRKNQWLEKKAEKNFERPFAPNDRARHFADTVELAVVKYYMRRVLSEKALIDKVNYRRFSADLHLNGRPISLGEASDLLKKKNQPHYFDFSDSTIRLNLSALYAVTYKGFSFNDIYSVSYLFSEKGTSEEVRLSGAASELFWILYNGNGIEIASVFVRMLETYVSLPIPPLETVNLMTICDNYPVYYGITSLAYIFDSAFAKNQEFKSYIRRKLISRYWKIYQRILHLKQLSSVISLCHLLSRLDLTLYRDLPSYEEKVILAFGTAEQAVKDMNADET
ncbi:MAG: hypothetical protein NC084_02310 [Bacteroides sp.]|nr:hypothetical protein [Eubacterium sp.]MCM1418920.1 hypothetical protein [Roseburia sp.]MCM1461529.1 hypothetical protein [Bacteroides sp.]